MKKLNRRSFLKKTSMSTAAIGAGSTFTSCSTKKAIPPAEGIYMGDFAAPKIENIRAAFIGVGARGGDHLTFFGKLENTEIVAISDLYQDYAEKGVASGGGYVATLAANRPQRPGTAASSGCTTAPRHP